MKKIKRVSEILNCKRNKSNKEKFSFIPFAICVCLIFISLYISGSAPVKKGELADPDCYMRLIRVSALYNTGCWYDSIITRSNAPYGDSLHWTRPFDVLLLAGALPIALFTDFESALFWWGVIISPVLLIATLIVLQWSIKPVLSSSKDGPFLACFVFVLQIAILSYYQPGRPDHHSLLVFFFILSIGLVLRMILRPFNAFLCYVAGAVGAFSIWVSVESMLTILIVMAVLSLLWILENGDFARKSLYYTLALFVVIGLSLVIERAWYDLLSEEYDRLSIVHLSGFGFITVLWIMIYLLNRRTQLFLKRANRFSFFLLGTAMLALTMLISFPKCYKGPYADIDPRIIPIYVSTISELQPIISSSYLVIPVQLIGSVIICFPLLCFLIFRDRCNEYRNGWLFILLAAVIFILISLYQIRWLPYAQILLIIPMALLIVLLRQTGPKAGFLKTLKNVFIVLIFSLGFLLLGLLADVIFKKGDSEKIHHEVSLIRICEYLTDSEKWQERSFRILTNIDFGAEILYRTRHEVIGTPYHRNSPGILDTSDIMTADTDEKAFEIIQKRGIDLILLCPKSTESALYSKTGRESTFYKRLRKDMIPNWLRKVELPSDLSSSFLLFETIE